ncbi:MAG: DNA polymerase I [Acidobacteria bacterium]|nr:DNA polymerase I [Acidobacteriota bacterium]MCB9397426.1 DNA polymerase I [Acidobacteriota bacterium]
MTRPRFFIIDAFAHIFRAYYAIRNIDHNAVFGFTNILKKIIESEKPEYIAVAFDSPEPSFRKELYAEYKANRDAPPEDLLPQIPLIKELIGAFNIPIIQMPGYEADDIIGTLANKASAQGVQVVIASGDKDMLQLVKDESVVMYDPNKGVLYMGESAVPDYFGVRADQIVDLLTIWGDSSDNVPGVPGVGEKGAKSLIQEYGNLAGIYENLDKIKRKAYREGFEKARPNIDLTRTLVTIKCDLDIPFDLASFAVQKPNRSKLTDLYRRLNFKTLLNQVPQDLETIQKSFPILESKKELQDWIAIIEKDQFMVFDTETTSIEPLDAELVGVSLATMKGEAAYIPLRHSGQSADWTETAESLLKPLFSNPGVRKVAHNLKYDLSVMKARGWQINGPFEDTMLMSYLINPTETRHSLDDLAETRLGYKTIHFEEVAGENKDQKTFDQVAIQEAAQYAAEDADICFRLYQLLSKELIELELERVYREVELPLIPVLRDMELMGIRVDVDLLREQSQQMENQLEKLEAEIYRLAGESFNINSPKQVGDMLFVKHKLPTFGKTGKTKEFSTSQDVLEKLAAMGHELPTQILEYRMVRKLKSTYVDELPKMIHPKSGRVHSSFNQFVTATGRLSSNNPNLQNIPIRTELGAEIRRAFIPQEGWTLVAADYSQIELRLLAHFSDDPVLVEGFRNGEDIHARTASEIMGIPIALVDSGMRRAAKSINFGLIYGMGEFRLSQELRIPRKVAGDYIRTYFEKMPRVQSFQKDLIAACKQSQEVRTLYGRRRLIPEINSRNKSLQNQGERLAVNTLIQGTAAELIKVAMIRLAHLIETENLQAHILLQVHDELVLECPPQEEERTRAALTRAMQEVGEFKVPLTVDAHCGPNWKEVK